jgi:hypothetical protein
VREWGVDGMVIEDYKLLDLAMVRLTWLWLGIDKWKYLPSCYFLTVVTVKGLYLKTLKMFDVSVTAIFPPLIFSYNRWVPLLVICWIVSVVERDVTALWFYQCSLFVETGCSLLSDHWIFWGSYHVSEVNRCASRDCGPT